MTEIDRAVSNEVTQADRKAAAPYAELLVISEPVETLAQSFARRALASIEGTGHE